MDIKEVRLRPEELVKLVNEVGWTAYLRQPDLLETGWNQSLKVLAAYQDGELIGAVRAVGDGATVLLIQDLIVRPAAQGQGVGSALLEAMCRCYPQVRQKLLLCDHEESLHRFYRKQGWTPVDEIRCTAWI